MNKHLNASTFSRKPAIALFCTAMLSACVSAPTRSDAEAFLLIKTGKVAKTNVQIFSDCLLDGFDKSHAMFTNVTSRQQRRSDSYRVETLAGGRVLIISADAFEDGRVALHESKSAALINTSGEREVFEQCLRKYGSVN